MTRARLEPLIHFVIPFVALMLAGVRFKKALLLSLFALTPDLDALFLIHRSLTHSIIFLLLVAAPLLLVLYKFKPRILRYGFIALFSVLSHPVLDLPSGYTPILWPLFSHSIWFQADLFAHMGSEVTLALNLHLLTEPVVFSYLRSLDAPLFTSSGLFTSLIALTPLLIKSLGQRFGRFQDV